ncbi:MAG: lipid A biosynthesis acyltransferase [Candidatus Pelagibacter sp. TMED153]|nr:MAG: lipid A biosynthesis acyltransferase [Candidatus Pelagibacter sp. TMED153]
MKFVKYFLEAILIYCFFIIGKLIGLYKARRLFSFIFKKIGPLIKSKNVVDKNLNKFLKKNFEESKNKIISDMWSNYGMTFIEYIFLNKLRNENSHIEIEGEKILSDISKSNKPVIFVSGHFANFELMSMEITKKKINLATIYRPLNNFFLNPFMEYLRKKYICKNQIKKGVKGVKDSIKFIDNDHSIALMIDQRVSEGIKIKFFNDDAFTTTLPAQLALKYKLNIVPIFIQRMNINNFKMKVFNPIDISNLNKLEITKKLSQILEKMISDNPGQWIWTHDRWK